MDELIFDLAEMITNPEDFAYVVAKLAAIYCIDLDVNVFECEQANWEDSVTA